MPDVWIKALPNPTDGAKVEHVEAGERVSRSRLKRLVRERLLRHLSSQLETLKGIVRHRSLTRW